MTYLTTIIFFIINRIDPYIWGKIMLNIPILPMPIANGEQFTKNWNDDIDY